MGIPATELRQGCVNFQGKEIHDSVDERTSCSVAVTLLAPVVNPKWYQKISSLVNAYTLTSQSSERFIITKTFRDEKKKNQL